MPKNFYDDLNPDPEAEREFRCITRGFNLAALVFAGIWIFSMIYF